MNTINIAVNLCMILFYAFLLWVYFSKKNMDNIENKIYKNLLYINGAIIVLHLLWLFTGALMENLFIPTLIWLNNSFAVVTFLVSAASTSTYGNVIQVPKITKAKINAAILLVISYSLSHDS